MAATDRPRRRATRGGRAGLGLGGRIFLITSLLIALAVGVSVVFTYLVAERIARSAAGEELASTTRLQEVFRGQRYDRLLDTAYTFAGDPYVAAYVGEGDARSLLDLVASRQAELGFDFAIVVDPDGRLLMRTDRPDEVGTDLAANPLVEAARESYEAAGIWRQGGRLYHAVALPFTAGSQLTGYLVAGFAINDADALELERLSGTDVAYLVRGEGTAGTRVTASTLDPAMADSLVAALGNGDALQRALAAAPPAGDGAGDGDGVAAGELEIGGERWIARLTPLRDAGGTAVGATAALTPLAPLLAPFRRIGQVLLLAGAAAVVAALALTFAFARRAMAPVRELVAATSAARGGDYDRRIPVRREDEVGELAHAFNDLLSDLREKRDMEQYLEDLSRTLPEPAPVGRPVAEGAQRGEVTVLAVEMRQQAAGGDSGTPEEVLDRYSADLGRLAQAAAARHGELMALVGHRAWVRFTGDGRTQRAFLCAAELARAFVAAGRSIEAPVMALAAGPAVTGAVGWGSERRATTLGRPLLRLESLTRESSPGDVAMTPEVEMELRPTFRTAGYEPLRQRSVFAGGTLYVVDSSTAASLAGGHSLPTVATAADAGAPAPAVPATLSGLGPGSVVGGRFEILAVLGAGGMGVVYKARDRELDEVVAVKMLKPGGREELSSAAGRLRDELRLARRITHPNVLRTYDLGEVSGIPFISMEYVRGVTLEQLLEHTERMAYSAGLSVAKQLCQGLAAAHAEGVLHRDIKPSNLILQANGNVKLMDFGIARPLHRSEPGKTMEGWLMGTPKYMAPEQLRGDEPDARSDVYACGVLLYEMFTGASPFTGGSYLELARKTMDEAPPPPSEHWPEIPSELERIVLRCLEKDPADRYQGAEELRADLDRLRA